jgi:hypothetical protein
VYLEETREGRAGVRRRPAVRRWIGASVAAVVCAGVVVWAAESRRGANLPAPLAAPQEPLLPNLQAAPPDELQAGTGDDTGEAYIFFTATIANVGRGPFLVHAVRAGDSSNWRVSQRFHEARGSVSERIVPGAELVWGGHGHNHWHVHLGASYQLRSRSGKLVREYAKVGFCFFDQLPLDPPPRFAARTQRIPKTTCNGRSRRSVDMGLSPGWQDPYQWTLPDQRLPVGGLADGVYRLVARADPDNWFRESDERDNTAWVDIRLTTSVSPARVRVLASGGPGVLPPAR